MRQPCGMIMVVIIVHISFRCGVGGGHGCGILQKGGSGKSKTVHQESANASMTVLSVSRRVRRLFLWDNLSLRLDKYITLVLVVPSEIVKIIGITNDRSPLEIVIGRRTGAVPLERRSAPGVCGSPRAPDQGVHQHDERHK